MSEPSVTKQCSACNENKPHSEFYGRNNKCKPCCIKKARDWQLAHPEKRRLIAARYNQSIKGRIKRKQYTQDEAFKARNKINQRRYNKSEKGVLQKTHYRHRNPDKLRARGAVRKAIENGTVLKTTEYTCTLCPCKATEYHHPSYKPKDRLNVIPVCFHCHRAIHKTLNTYTQIPIQQNLAYKTLP